MLKDFYTIINKISGQNSEYRIKLNPKHEIFKGHFPGQPVTPGVVLIQMTTELTQNTIEQNVCFHDDERCGFACFGFLYRSRNGTGSKP